MALTRCRVGQLIEAVDERNSLGIRAFFGVNKEKTFMPTAANTDGLDESKYKLVRSGRFVFSGMQTGRDKCIRIAMYSGEEPILVSPTYTTFEVVALDLIIPEYLFMLFKSEEMDRLGWFYSDSSIRSNLDWDRFCDIEIDLPSIEVQEKYVAIYNGMLENQRCYERGLGDLKLTCDAEMDRLKHTSCPRRALGSMLVEVDVRNRNLHCSEAMGINIKKEFMVSAASSDDLSKYKVVRPGQFAYSSMQTGRDRCIRIALHDGEEQIAVSPAYSVLETKDETVDLRYLMAWFSRDENDRLGWFLSDASIRANLDLPRFYEIEIPVPTASIQKAIVGIYESLSERKRINEQLKAQIRSLCPILIKGSLEEAAR